MSLSLIIQTPDSIIISGDSRACMTEGGIDYANGDNVSKLCRIGDKVIFTGGSQWVAREALERYRQSDDKSINNLNEIGRQVTKEYTKLYLDAEIE